MPSPVGAVNPDQYIFVPSKFQIKPGAKITNNMFVGPGLGVGLQVPPLVLAACQFAKATVCNAPNSQYCATDC